MKLSTLVVLAATVFVPATAFADSSQPMSAPSKEAPNGAMMDKSKASPAPTTSGSSTIDKTTTPATDPQKRSMDDPNQYGKPDRH